MQTNPPGLRDQSNLPVPSGTVTWLADCGHFDRKSGLLREETTFHSETSGTKAPASLRRPQHAGGAVSVTGQ